MSAVLAVGERRTSLTGRAAALTALIAKHQHAINRPTLGKLEISFAPGQIVITLQESLDRVTLS